MHKNDMLDKAGSKFSLVLTAALQAFRNNNYISSFSIHLLESQHPIYTIYTSTDIPYTTRLLLISAPYENMWRKKERWNLMTKIPQERRHSSFLYFGCTITLQTVTLPLHTTIQQFIHNREPAILWPRSLKRNFPGARLLGLRVRILQGHAYLSLLQ